MSPVAEATRRGPLAGVRVLDLTSVIMGPVCTQILADYGAAVVKVEPPEGDVMRHAGAKTSPQMGAMFLHANEGKQSLVLDLKTEAGRATLRRMLPSFDVFIHNVRPQAMQRLGLDEAAVRALHPAVIYVELTGYAESGPYAGRAAFDDIIQAQTGLADLFARQSGGAPAYVPTLIADRVTGLTAAHATLAALYRRRETGQGDGIRVSMFETMAAFVLADHLGGASFQPPAGAMGYSRLLTPHRRPYRTLDGHVAVVVYNDKHWRAFFEATGALATFASDARFQTAAARADHYDAIYGYLAGVLATRSSADWLALLQTADIPCCPVNRIEDLLDEPQLRAVGFFDETSTQDGHTLRRIAPRYRAPFAQAASVAPSPRVGQHTAALTAAALFPETPEFLDTHLMQTLQHAKLSVTDDGVATLQIANGTSLNILNSDTIVELTEALRALARNDSVRVLVIRGSGDKAFIGGADIKELAKLDPGTAVAFITRLHDLCEAVRDFPLPTIARLAGWCMGGGMELAAACDIRIGSALAHFAMPEVRIGIPSVIHANLLPRLIGEGNTRWLLLTGAAIDGEKALKWGFMNDMVAPEELDAAIAHAVAEILECAPRGVRAQKALLRTWEASAIERGLKDSIALFGSMYQTPEPGEYMQRFIDRKRSR